jgi:signal transduction histidine kinase
MSQGPAASPPSIRPIGSSSEQVRRGVLARTTVRWRLTLLYGALFLICGVGLLAITYVLVAHASITPPTLGPCCAHHPAGHNYALPAPQHRALITPFGRLRSSYAGGRLRFQQRVSDLHRLIVESGIALAIMAVVSMLLGWLVAGRVLAPLRTITATTQRISATSLHQRLAIQGPQDELRQLGETIDGLLERLEVSFEAQRRFVANASHELRTPLTAMRLALDVALAKSHAPPQLRALEANLRADLDQADGLLESFLVLARAEHNQLGSQVSVSLDQLLANAIASHNDAIEAKQIELHTALAPVRVTGSETLLARMIDNVIDNAIRHNQPDGVINLTCELDGESARLVIQSGGPVLDQDAVAQLAQPFQRLGAERTGSENGHGLGLSIVATIAAAHGGDLRLHARPEGGLQVQITLPHASVPQTTPAPA